MTWLLLAFTWRVVTITNQYDTPYCVAHAVATCWSIYGYRWDADYYVDKLHIGYDGYNVRWLPQALYNMRVSRPRTYTRDKATKILSRWPVIINIESREVNIWSWETNWHTMCWVWYDDNYLYVANSRGTWRWIQWYGMIASWDIQFVTLQTLWSKTLMPSLITLTEPKEDFEEYKQVDRSPTIKENNTKNKYLKRWDQTRD